MRYFAGIDGGGTKTAVCVADINDFSVRGVTASGASWREYGAENVARSFKEAVDSLIDDAHGGIGGIAMGLPCHGESETGDREMAAALRQSFPNVPLYLTNDVEVGWAGSLALQPGINIVSGTGSIAFGKDACGQTARSGGWSEFFGDEGSCYWVGRRTVELFSKQADRRIPKDALYDVVCRDLALKNDYDIIDLVHNDYLQRRERVAGLQLLAAKAADLGAPSALSLYREAAQELTLLVSAVLKQLNFNNKPFIVSYTGGLFKAKAFVLPHLSEAVRNMGGTLAPPRFRPEEGALLLAFNHFYPDGLTRMQTALQKMDRTGLRKH